MTTLIAARGAQYPLVMTFTFNFDDTMADTTGATADFKTVATTAFDIINLPVGAVVIGGEVVTETAITGSTAYNISIGDSGSATRYLGVTDRVGAGRSGLVPTGYVGTGENLRLTLTPTVAEATAGKVTVRVEFVLPNRTNEIYPN